jgi:mannan endo-1,4-beta-mannosidase
MLLAFWGASASAATTYSLLGQPDLASTTLDSRCADPNAQFNFTNSAGFDMHGPSGIAIDPRGRVYVTDFAGKRVLSWPNFEALSQCLAADEVIGAGSLSGPEAVAIDIPTGTVFVADTLSHTVKGFRKNATGIWQLSVTLGQQGVSGAAMNRFFYPRGLAIDSRSRLFVADDYNHRILLFDAPFTNNESAVDSIGAWGNGGFNHPKGLAISGETLFVADYDKNRVLRFTGPFTTPDQTYVASAVFTGLNKPVDLAVHPDGSLLVTDQGNVRIARYTDAIFSASKTRPTTTFADNLNPEPLGIAADRNGRIYMADYRAYRVLIRDEGVRKTPVSSNASVASKALLTDLYSRPNKETRRVAVGQMLLTWDQTHWNDDWQQLVTAGLPLPKMMGGEIAELSGEFANTAATQALLAHGVAGNMVTLGWHPSNPANPALGFKGTPFTTAQLRDMLNDSTAIGQAWQAQLEATAAYLQQYKDHNVPVLFRPLHEQNSAWFWWGHQNGLSGTALAARQAAWVAVWRDMVNELVVNKGLNNLLFVFSPNQVSYNGIAPPMTYYPGSAAVDIVGLDTYDDALDLAGSARGLQHYAAMIGTGKPFGLSEFGQSADDVAGTGADGAAWDALTLRQRVKDSYPRMAFAMAWCSSTKNGLPYLFALPDVSNTDALLNDPLMDTVPNNAVAPKAVRSLFNYTYTRDGSPTQYTVDAIVYKLPTITPTTNRPVIVLTPGWGGNGNVAPQEPSATAKKLADEGYIVASVGFKQSGGAWESDLPYSVKGFLQAYYASNPQSSPLAMFWGNSYSGLQSKVVVHYLRGQGLPVRGLLSTDAGYNVPGWQSPPYADTTQYSVAMVQNLGDTTVDPNVCKSWGDCGARERAIFHRNRGDNHVYSQCFAGGSHGSRPVGWDQWTVNALKIMIHTDWAYPTWQGYVPPSQVVSNSCQ